MGFKDTFNKWENENKSANFGDIFSKWEKNNAIVDKDKVENENKTPPPGEIRRRLLNSKPDAEIDIHGLTGDETWLSLETFFNNARDKGFKKLRIIHGKGNRSKGKAVLGDVVRKFIERCPFAGENGFEKASDGGSGSTWVLLKQAAHG